MPRPKNKRNTEKPQRPSGPTMADQANLYELYQDAVQSPEDDLEFYTKTFKSIRGRLPVSLREDFCGTALLASEWCKSKKNRTAIGVDLDQETLDWGKEKNVSPAIEDRLTLICDDVRKPNGPKVDMSCAMNFSYCVFKKRQELLEYFKTAFEGLNKDGLFFLELYGGTEAIIAYEEEREVEGDNEDEDADFTYVWDQDNFNPITRETTCYIHFHFEDGSKIKKAFTYDWRLWSIPEICEVLTEAGFSKTRVFWEEMVESEEDEDEYEGSGEYSEVTDVENQESWVVFIVGQV